MCPCQYQSILKVRFYRINPNDFDVMAKTISDRLHRLPIGILTRNKYSIGSITWGDDSSISFRKNLNSESITIDYVVNEQSITETFNLSTSPCHYGNFRYWFTCHCGRRVGNLYLYQKYFRCRHCHDLTYRSKATNLRSGKYAGLRYLDRFEKAQELEDKSKRNTWRNIPTKKKQRLERFYLKQLEVVGEFDQYEKRHKK